MGYMAGGDNLARPFAMAGLVVKKHIGCKGLQKRRFIQPAKKQRLVQTNIPPRSVRITRSWAGAERAVTSAVRIGQSPSGNSRCNRFNAFRKPLNGPPRKRAACRLALKGLKRLQAAGL